MIICLTFFCEYYTCLILIRQNQSIVLSYVQVAIAITPSLVMINNDH